MCAQTYNMHTIVCTHDIHDMHISYLCIIAICSYCAHTHTCVHTYMGHIHIYTYIHTYIHECINRTSLKIFDYCVIVLVDFVDFITRGIFLFYATCTVVTLLLFVLLWLLKTFVWTGRNLDQHLNKILKSTASIHLRDFHE